MNDGSHASMKKSQLLVILGLVLVVVIPLVGAAQSTQESRIDRANRSHARLQDMVDELSSKFDLLARESKARGTFAGLISPFSHPSIKNGVDVYTLIPRGWVVCDGKRIDESHPRKFREDEVAPEFWKTESPDLRHKFIRGVGAEGTIDIEDGKDAISVKHTHGVGGRTGGARADVGAKGRGGAWDDNTGGGGRLVAASNNNQEGNHVHDSYNLGTNSISYPGALPKADQLLLPTVPKHRTVIFLMRIK